MPCDLRTVFPIVALFGTCGLHSASGYGRRPLAASGLMGGSWLLTPSPATRGGLPMRRLWQRTRRHIDIREGSAERLPIEADSVDAAFSINAAHHFDDNEVAAAELTRVLKPGGRLLLVDEDFTNPNHPYNQHRHAADEPEPVDAIHIAKLLTAAGLTVTQTDHRRRHRHHH